MKKNIYPDLNAMRNVDIQYIDPDSIPDIRDVTVDKDKPVSERVSDYINQAKNPYFIRYKNILVKMEYPETETTIEDCIEGYFRSLT